MIEHIDINMLVAFTFVAGIGGTIWCLASDLLRAWQAWRHRRKLRSQVRRHSRELAIAVRDGVVKLDKALEQVEAARKELESFCFSVSESRFPYAPSG
jgi:hypothetical protein